MLTCLRFHHRRKTLPWFLAALLICSVDTFSQTSLLQSGPMVGYGEMTEVMLWAQTTKPATVQFRYWSLDDSKNKMMSRKVSTMESDAYTAHVLITGLKPGKKFEYELLLDGKVVRRPYPLRFQTQPLWQWRTDPPDFTVAFGSCLYVNEPESDRPGKPYGSHYETLTRIVDQHPDVMLWLGDNTYTREVDWNTVAGIRHRYSHTRALPELQPLLGATHNYAIWDDHDYGPNDSDRSYRLKEQSLETFKLFWGNQLYGMDEVPGVFQRFEWGDVEFFVLDDRYYRSPDQAPDDEAKTMFGKEQLLWLMDGLTSSNATFKVVVGGGQMLNPYHYYEAFSDYGREYKKLLSDIKERKIRGIFFLSGDRHYSELLRLTDSTFYPLYDFTSSPLSAGLSAPKDLEVNSSYRVPTTLVSDAQGFGVLRFSGKRTDRKVVLECRDYTGALRWSYEIKANDLRPPK